MPVRKDLSSLPILVTGAAGFIGARFVESCNARGIPVVSADDPKLFKERPEHAGCDFGKIVNYERLFEWLADETEKAGHPPVRAAVHMGACSDTTVLDEEFLRRVNLEYTKKLWIYCARQQIPLVYASSAATYGAGELGYADDEGLITKLKPLNPYGESKRAFDEWALAEERAGHRPPTWAGFKFFNVYGFGERHKGKMASVVLHGWDQIQAGGAIRLFKSHKEGIADGEQKRDFVFVDDVIDVLHFALEKPLSRGIYNLGSGEARSFLDLARATFRAAGVKEKIEFVPTPEALRERYQYFTQAEMNRLREAGYKKPFTSLEAGVEKYVKRLQPEN